MREQLLNKSVNVYNYSGSYIGYYFRLYVYLNNQDIPGNTSDITITLYGKANTSTGGGYSGFSTPTAKVRIGNEDKNSRSGVNIPTSGAEVSMATWRGNVEHNDDGSLSISVSGIYAPNTTSYNFLPQATTISSTITLPTIARASTVTVPATLISSSSGNVTATITSKADYWHKWRRYIVGTTVPGWNTKGEINNTTATVTVSYSDILNAMPNDWQGKLHIDVATYSSSSYSTQIGSTQYAEADITINKNYIKPSCSIGNITYNSNPAGAPNYIIAGYSKASVTITNITQGVGATTSKNIQVDFYKGSSRLYTSFSTITGSSTTVVSGIMPSSTATYQIKAKVTVTDSRTAYTTAESSEANVYGYDKPTLTFTAYRVGSSGSTNYDGAGGYVYLSVTGTVNGSVPSNAIQTWTCKQDSSSGTAIPLDNSTHRAWFTLATTRSKTFYGRVTDKVSTSSNTIYIPVASYPLDLYDNGSGTVGVGLGTLASSGVVTSGLPIDVKYTNTSGGRERAVRVYDTSHTGYLYLGFGTGHQNHGVYSSGYAPTRTTWTSSGRWLIYRTSDNSIVIGGTDYTVGANNQPMYLNAGVLTAVQNPVSGAWWRGVPQVGTNGVMHIGKYLNFHNSTSATTTYDTQLTSDSAGVLKILYSGQLAISRWMQGTSTASNTSATAGTFYRVVIGSTTQNNPTIDSSNTTLFMNTSNGIKINKTGKYKVSGSIYIGTGSNGRAGAYIYDTNNRDFTAGTSTELIGNALYGNGTDVVVTIAPKIVSLTAGHVIHLVRRTMTANGTIYNNNKSTYLLVEWVGS